MEPAQAIYIGSRTLFVGPDGLYYDLHQNANDEVTYCNQIGDLLDLNFFMLGLEPPRGIR